jgi:hypothetical protein
MRVLGSRQFAMLTLGMSVPLLFSFQLKAPPPYLQGLPFILIWTWAVVSTITVPVLTGLEIIACVFHPERPALFDAADREARGRGVEIHRDGPDFHASRRWLFRRVARVEGDAPGDRGSDRSLHAEIGDVDAVDADRHRGKLALVRSLRAAAIDHHDVLARRDV